MGAPTMDHFGYDASDYDAIDLGDDFGDDRPTWAEAYEPPVSPAAAAQRAMDAAIAGGWVNSAWLDTSHT